MAKKSLTFGELGATGLPVYSGRVSDEPVSTLSHTEWIKAVRLMSTTDATVRSFLFMIEMITRQVEWKILPWDGKAENDELADFVRECLFEDMENTWQDTVSEILSMLEWGWSWFEIVYKRRSGPTDDAATNSRYTDGRIGWRKWAIRSQESLYEWVFSDSDDIAAMIQQPAPTFEVLTIPASKSLHFRTSTRKNNPEGISVLRGPYRSWYFKSNIENIEGIGIERDLAGLPKIGAPAEIFKETATSDEKAVYAYLQKLLTEIRQNESAGVLYPLEYDSFGNKKYEIELMSSGGERQFDTSAVIDRYDQRILMSVMADFLMLGSKNVGSFALGETKLQTFLKAVKTFLDAICEVVNRKAIPQLVKLNGKPLEKLPYLEAGTLNHISLTELGTFVQTLTAAGVTFSEEEQAYLKGQANIPADIISTGPIVKTKPVDEKPKPDETNTKTDTKQ